MHDDDDKTKPLAVGLILTLDRTPQEVADLKTSIASRAIREGYCLLNTYEATVGNFESTIDRLLVSVRAARAALDNPRAVLLPTKGDLGTSGSARLETAERLDENDLVVVLLK